MIIIIVAVMILNQNWMVTSIGIIFAFFSWCLYLGLTCEFYVGVLGGQFVLLVTVLTIMTYFIELKYKSEFLQIRYNKTMKSEFRHMLQVIPEAILIYDPASKQLSFANAELKRLLAKFSGVFSPDNSKFSETERNMIDDSPHRTQRQATT